MPRSLSTTSATRFSRGHQQLIFHSPGTVSSEQLDPRATPSSSSPRPLFAVTNAENGVANGIFNTTNPANVTDQPSPMHSSDAPCTDSFFNISNVRIDDGIHHDAIDQRSKINGGKGIEEKLKLYRRIEPTLYRPFISFGVKMEREREREREKRRKNSFVSGKRDASLISVVL